ncbi:hypothetical protein NEOLI_005437 [Neolecta irregularis DAH-3]|uniref:Uncharacterized protein n=1 Tax=Neolecta irregularis (strain DAH-3) TaxID=1198029 RepID=A0A1U7LKV2_NEOID|nr:hypothetical protein NEOLI_005437 [Neolecta irregularis DAH-3]|eukprot:OLL23285.1 hypothetical protein NEOLI_005437 [Neolecta irregularis DAH-3]
MEIEDVGSGDATGGKGGPQGVWEDEVFCEEVAGDGDGRGGWREWVVDVGERVEQERADRLVAGGGRGEHCDAVDDRGEGAEAVLGVARAIDGEVKEQRLGGDEVTETRSW